MAVATFTIQDLSAGTGNKRILHDINLRIRPGQIVALMGPNGSGKSTLANAVMGHPESQVQSGRVVWQGKNILRLKPWERSRLGLFLGFQYPLELPGVNLLEFLLTAAQAQGHGKINQTELDTRIDRALKDLRLPKKFLERSVNEGFSGGEKKKVELLQLLVLQPKIAILDEADSGLDIDALRYIARGINQAAKRGTGFLIITHYQRLLSYVKPDRVHVLLRGTLVRSGDRRLVNLLERRGYDCLKAPA